MTLARRQIMTLAVFGAVTAGGGAAIAEANNSGSQPTQNPSQPAADAVAARSARCATRSPCYCTRTRRCTRPCMTPVVT